MDSNKYLANYKNKVLACFQTRPQDLRMSDQKTDNEFDSTQQNPINKYKYVQKH